MKNSLVIILIVGMLIALGAGAWFFTRGGESLLDNEGSRGTNVTIQETPNEIQEEIQGGTIEEADAANTAIYRSTSYGFSFEYPEGYSVSLLPDLGGEVLLVQSADKEEEFQVFIAPFDEPGPITPARIAQDLPDLKIVEPQQVVIGNGKIDALIFKGESEDFGESREVWFVANDHLYQLTTYINLDQFIGPILETWTFN